MKRPTLAEAGRFILIMFGVLLIELVARAFLFDGPREKLGGIDVVIAIACAGSKAGMMPSVRHSSWNAASASMSVTLV